MGQSHEHKAAEVYADTVLGDLSMKSQRGRKIWRDSRAARPGSPVDARLEGRVALADGRIGVVLKCVHLHERPSFIRAPDPVCRGKLRMSNVASFKVSKQTVAMQCEGVCCQAEQQYSQSLRRLH